MKKIISLFLVTVFIFALVSCSDYYKPQKSTKEEAKVVAEIRFGEDVYEIKYELYRAFFLNFKNDIDGGDASVWQGAEKDKYIEKINALIFSRISDIFAIFSLAKGIGVDVYSKEYDNSVLEIIKASVDGGIIAGTSYTGFGGDYDAYLASLKAMNLNYSVQDLMIRYALALDDIYYYYGGNVDNDAKPGALGHTREDVKAFYDSDECVRVYQLFLSKHTTSFTEESAGKLRDKIASRTSEEDVVITMIGNSTYGDDIKDGEIIAKYNLDSFYYEDLINAAFALKYYETSPVIEIKTASDDGYFILFRTRKSDAHFEECYDDIATVYVENAIGKMIVDRTAALLSTLVKTENYNKIEHSKISMD